jgi:hypothetical protein
VRVAPSDSLGFSDSIDAYRQFTGSSTLVGARVISNEMGAVFERAYSYTIPELLFSIDRAVVNGINQVILHGQAYTGDYPATSWPGYTTFFYLFSEMYSNKQPSWDHGLAEVLDYMARTQFIQQQAVTRVDVAIMNANSATNTTWTSIYQPTDLEDYGKYK